MVRERRVFNELSEAEKASLSRTTLWRGERRGWVFLNYQKKDFSKTDDTIFESAYNDLKRRALYVCLQFNFYQRKFIYCKRGLSFEDLMQECLVAAWQLSGHSAFHFKSFQQSVMRNRLLDLAK